MQQYFGSHPQEMRKKLATKPNPKTSDGSKLAMLNLMGVLVSENSWHFQDVGWPLLDCTWHVLAA